MKALKTLTTRGLIAGGLLAAGAALSIPVLADDDYRRGAYDNSRDGYSARYDRRHNSAYQRGRYANSGQHGPVTVRLRYDANGSGNIALKRMLRDQHGIDTSDWRIRSVNIRNKSRRDACADLTVGGRSTGPVNLRRGITTIAAPRSRSDGRWVLGFENARVRDVAVVLEPRGNRDGKYRPLDKRHDRNDDYAYRGTRNRSQRSLSFNVYSR